ncbi:RHS repeat-associated protein [Streptomyces sp. SFB5A]|uniref:RHS repeat-associated protein n=2 Tax=Streptomyces nymphaeiformis TaxID=2663842 RepID=A0A7W7TY35_9ACTN|nr:RHS repeat-associated protein [Streptomyces nymphaeiformis]
MSAVAGTLLPQVAYAAPQSPANNDDGKGVVDTIAGWFSDDDEGVSKPPAGGNLEIPSREKLPKGEKLPKAKRVKELTDRRTSQARFWQMSDGRIEAELTAVPTAYRSGKSWKPVETTVRATRDMGFDFANTANTGKSWFGSDAGRFMRFEAEGGGAVTFGLSGADALRPEAKGDRVVYKDALAGADLSYRVGNGQVKEDIVLAERPAGPVSFTFTLDTEGGLTPKTRKDGSIAFFGEAPGTPVMVIPAPYMTDAKKDAQSVTGGTYSTKVAQKLTRNADGKGWKLTVMPDAKWLTAKERQYPVVIDPTITITPIDSDSEDTMVLSDQPGVNFNNTWKLSVGKTDTGVSRSLIKFPLDEIPAGVKVDAARLSLYYDQAHTTNANAVALEAHRATGAWSEAGATPATWSNTSALVGELSGTTVQQDDGDAGTAAVGEWPRSTTTGGAATNDDYAYNKNALTGESYTWQPRVPETDTYRVDVHYPAAADAATAAPYTVTYNGGTKNYTVNQTGTGGVWKTLDAAELSFAKGNAGKILLGDTGSSTTRTLADSVRLVNPAEITKAAWDYNKWHDFPVADTVQKWVSGTAANYGFVLKAKDESGTAPTGGPRYEAADGNAYGDETSTYPRLTVTYGAVGTSLNSPTVVHSTGPELSWPAYANSSGDSGLDIVEYQLHRSTQQVFTPSAATLIAPIALTATTYTDTTAVPTPDSSSAEIGKSYYYQLAVKTKSGQLLGSPTRIVGIPKAGRTMKIIQAGQTDTTLSSLQPTVNHDGLVSGKAQTWLSVGNNSGTYGKTRAVLKFPTTSIPTTATVLENKMYMWGAETTSTTNGTIYELHALTRDFTETQATWNNATSTTPWTTAGGDFSATVSDTVPQITDEVGRHWWDATGLMQSWVRTPTNNKGVLVKLKDETTTGPQERTLFLSAEASDPQLRPYMQVIYVDATTEDTYYAPTTPARMTPNSQYTVEFTVTNTTSAAWAAGERVLSYTWKLPDGTDVTTGGNQLSTAIPALLPGKSATIQAQVKTPINSDEGNKRLDYVLGWDIKKVADGTWLSAGTGAIPSLKQNVTVEDPTSNTLGLEKFYSYTGKNTGAGSTVMNNLASGNSVWSYNAFTNPGRGLTTFARFAYNSLDTSDTVLGHGWSGQAAGPTRLGAPLEFHPKPNPTEIRLPDGDGTTHVFRWDATNSVWKAPAGVHYKLTMKAGLDCKPTKDPVPDAWTLTRPDGTRFLFGCDGYMTSAVDKNGNTQTYTYEERKSNNKPTKFLTYITDPADRQSLTVDYYKKGDATYEYINDSGVKVSGTNLTNSKIYDHVKSMTDISGRKISFYYTDKGLLGQFTDGAGSSQPKDFKFTYDATQGNKNVKLVKATDPRGNATQLAYYAPQVGDDPKYHWWTKTITDRLNGTTNFAYAANAGNSKFTDTKATDAENHATDYVTDDFGRPVQTTNAKSQTAKMSWDADNNVTYLEEANGAKTAYCYDQKTGYPLWQRDAENNKAGVPPSSECAPGTYPVNAAKYEYQTRLDGYSADLFRKTSPEGRTWQFGYDTFGNLKTVTDPKGVATTSVPDDYTTKYDYDSYGQLAKATDANGNPTTNSGFGPTGYPATITDALNKATTFVYDERGQVTQATDALGKKTTQTYDTFGRPLINTVPKDQNAGVLITTPAPVYDANDNVTTSTAPNGAVSTAVYDAADQISEATAPKDTSTGPERKSAYTYDKAGHLRTTIEPKGTATTADPNDYLTTNNYDEIYQLTSAVNAAGDKVSYEYDNVGNITTVVDPKKNATADTTDYTSKTAYDLNHRVTTVTDAVGKTTSRSYDKDSLVVSSTDAENNTTEVTYDERGKQTQVKAPYTGTSPGITYRTTKYEYDQVGNTTKVISPRGVDTAAADDFTARTEYDALNRPVKKFQPYDPADARYNNPNVYTQTVYDEVGRVSKTSLPPSEGQTVRNDTTYSYFDNGWAKSSTDPWDIVTTYDYDELGKQTARTLTSAGGSSNRTMSWSYFPDGKLKSKSDDGVPVGSAVVLADNSDTQNTTSTGTWTKGSLTGQQGYDHQVHAAGAGTDAFTWTLNIPKDGTYTAYVKYPQVTGAATAAKYTVTHSTGTTDVTKDQNAAAGSWVSLGSFTFTQGNAAKLQLFQNSAGAVVADGVKLVRNNAGDTDNEKKTFAYAYDVNGNMTSIDDTSSGAKIDAYTIAYTGLNQVQKVTEALAGQEKKSTSYTYDTNGQPETVTHPDQYSKYTYDLRGLVKTVSVGKTATDTNPKITNYTYTDRRLKLQETKANGNTVDYTYYLNAALKTQTEKKPNGTLVSSHTYAYDANGNKAQDVAKKMNADNHAAYLDSTTDYIYDPVERLAKSVKTGNGAGTESYVHDDNANVISQTVKSTSTTYSYDRNRLLSATTSGVSASYNYDPFGRQESSTSGGQVIERSLYDGFDHVIESSKLDGGSMKTTKYTFDPLDRTSTKTADGKTTDFTYLGLSNEVLNEEVAGVLTASYQYSPWGERLSQVKHNTDGTTEDGYYGYNSHTDVEALTTKDGDTKATYGYTAYGSDDKAEFTGIDKPDAADPTKEAYNPYRFNAKRWDAQAGTYDMGFRDYNPGLNRFTSRDMYNGALADMGLGADPYTGNRYAFTGGNPTSRVELDGHDWWDTVKSVFKGGGSVATKTAGSGWLTAIEVFGNVIGWNSDNGPKKTPYDESKPKYKSGLFVEPQEINEYSNYDSYPSSVTKDGCKDSGNTAAFYMPLDSAGRAQGVMACLNKANINNFDKETGEIGEDGPGLVGSETVWPTDNPLFIPEGMREGQSLYGQGLHRGHLLGNQFGGTGRDIRNLVPMYPTTNLSRMKRVETQIANHLRAGETVYYSAMAHYPDGNTYIPDSVTITWYSADTGAGGTFPVANTP